MPAIAEIYPELTGIKMVWQSRAKELDAFKTCEFLAETCGPSHGVNLNLVAIIKKKGFISFLKKEAGALKIEMDIWGGAEKVTAPFDMTVKLGGKE